MRAGIVVSAVGHAGLIALAIVGIGMTRPFEAQPVESISVDLISIEEFSNIRKGVLDSTVVETETPSIVDTEIPAEVAQPTGNTEENQATPEDTAIVTPAPTQQTAPEPVPEPTPEPVVEPEPAPPPEPEPAPAPAPEPVPAPEPAPAPEPVPEPAPPVAEIAAPTPSEDPSSVAPRPVARTAALEEKRADFKKKREAAERKKKEDAAAEKKKREDAKKEAERIREAKRRQDEAARLADEVANIINTEESRGATTGAGGQASLGKETGTAARLSRSQMDALVSQIRGCLSVPLGATEAGVQARISFDIDAGGNPSVPTLMAPASSQLEQAYASAAIRAIQRCGPYTMAAGQNVAALFDAREF